MEEVHAVTQNSWSMDKTDMEANISGLWQDVDEIRTILEEAHAEGQDESWDIDMEEYSSISERWDSLPDAAIRGLVSRLVLISCLKDEASKRILLGVLDAVESAVQQKSTAQANSA